MTTDKKLAAGNNNRGFTLVETLVAITILVIAIVGPLYAIHKSVTASYTARDHLVATALAQEAVEFVRSARDTNYLSERGWLTGLEDCIVDSSGDYGCVIDPGTGNIDPCASGTSGCPKLTLHPTTRLYTQTPGLPETPFKRKVTIEPVGAGGNEIKVTVTVSWSTLRVSYTSSVTEYLHNWL
jgi:prepilin-type N-terminal cleavage/methylation domain-containing protein